MSICYGIILIRKNQEYQLVHVILNHKVNFIEGNKCLKLMQFDHLGIHLSLMIFQRLVYSYAQFIAIPRLDMHFEIRKLLTTRLLLFIISEAKF